MVYAVLDEYYPNKSGNHPIQIGCFLVFQDRFNAWWRCFQEASTRHTPFRRLTGDPESVTREGMERTRALFIRTTSTAIGFRASGVTRQFVDGDKLARGSQIWSWALTQGLLRALRCSQELGWGSFTVDVFHDRHDWKEWQREGEIETLRGFRLDRSDVRLRRIVEVPKSDGKYALGTLLAHSCLKLQRPEGSDRFFDFDLSEALTSAMTADLDGSAGRKLRARRLGASKIGPSNWAQR